MSHEVKPLKSRKTRRLSSSTPKALFFFLQ